MLDRGSTFFDVSVGEIDRIAHLRQRNRIFLIL